MKEIIIEVPDGFGKTLKPEKVNSEIKGELVRCKDCKHAFDVGDGWIYCEKGLELDNSNMFRPDWFCADGERR